MRFRRLASYAALGFGAAIAVNAALRQTPDDLDAALGGERGSYRWRGMDVAYSEAGDPDDPDLVLLHGINAAGSSGEFREVFDALAEDYHVVAPDLPGFGRSDRPPLRYSAALYEDFLVDFVGEFREPAVVASSLTSAYAVAAAVHSGISQFVLVCPTSVAGPEPPKRWLRELLRAPVVGEALFNVLTAKPSIRLFNGDHAYYDPNRVSEDWVDYEWRTCHQRNARFAPASFVSGYLNSDVRLGAALAALDAPTTLVWGREAELPPLSEGRELAEEADARLVVFDRTKLLPHVEYPEQFVDAVRESLRITA